MQSVFMDVIRRTRQHHAIEHATIHMLAVRFPEQTFVGHSDPLGFNVYGEVPEVGLRRAVGDALLRLQAGERGLAIHPNCGTNLATTGVLATLAALLAGSGRRRGFLDRFATALIFVLAAMFVAKPLGFRLQHYTTLADVADRWVADIRPIKVGNLTGHRVIFD